MQGAINAGVWNPKEDDTEKNTFYSDLFMPYIFV
jgi:hypothetical protein